MKFGEVVQWVQAPPDQSLASGSLVSPLCNSLSLCDFGHPDGLCNSLSLCDFGHLDGLCNCRNRCDFGKLDGLCNCRNRCDFGKLEYPLIYPGVNRIGPSSPGDADMLRRLIWGLDPGRAGPR